MPEANAEIRRWACNRDVWCLTELSGVRRAGDGRSRESLRIHEFGCYERLFGVGCWLLVRELPVCLRSPRDGNGLNLRPNSQRS